MGAMRLAIVCPLLVACSFEHGVIPGATGDGGGGKNDGGTGNGIPDAPPGSTVIGLHANADTWLRQQFPTEIHGADVDLRAGSGSTWARANRVIIQFDVSSVPLSCDLQEARLFLYFFQEDFANVSPTLGAFRVSSSWDESAATWENRTAQSTWSSGGGDFDSFPVDTDVITASSFGWHSWDVSGLVVAWRTGLSSNYGVAIAEPNDNAGNDGRKLFYSTQSSPTPTDLRPYLRVICK